MDVRPAGVVHGCVGARRALPVRDAQQLGHADHLGPRPPARFTGGALVGVDGAPVVVGDQQGLVVEQPTHQLLGVIVERSPTAIRLGKTGFHAIEDMPLAKAFEYAQLMLPNMARTQDAKEGFTAFREKRPAKFQGN